MGPEEASKRPARIGANISGIIRISAGGTKVRAEPAGGLGARIGDFSEFLFPVKVIRMAQAYLIAKSIHIVGFISWLAGLFYIVRLFVYFEEARARPAHEAEILTKQLALMQGRLWKIIARPAMIATVAAGLWTIHTRFGFAHMPIWLHVKLGFVLLLLFYHYQCSRILGAHARGESCGWSSTRLRVFNELATLLMVGIVVLAVFKNATSVVWGLLAWVGLGVVLMVALRLYKKQRLKAAKPAEDANE